MEQITSFEFAEIMLMCPAYGIFLVFANSRKYDSNGEYEKKSFVAWLTEYLWFVQGYCEKNIQEEIDRIAEAL